MALISVTRALAEVKSLNDRIGRGSRVPFIGTTVGGKVSTGMTKEETERLAASNLQSVVDLIARRKLLKAAIVKSNSITDVVIAGVTMTVAEAIERKGSIQLEQDLLQNLRGQLAQAKARVEQGNIQMQQRLDQMILAAVGKDRKASQDEIDAITTPFKASNEYALLDPSGLEGKVTELELSINDFLLEVDYALSEANASTKIDV